eukprot:COSAG02_NODE_15161_length_1198_cov_1.061874_2_plen_296_part_01
MMTLVSQTELPATVGQGMDFSTSFNPVIASAITISVYTDDTSASLEMVGYDSRSNIVVPAVSLPATAGTESSYDVILDSPAKVSFIHIISTSQTARVVAITARGVYANDCQPIIATCVSCSNGVLDGDETGIDCGGPTCPLRCGVDSTCDSDLDCTTGKCDMDTGLCREYSAIELCTNGIKDAHETDIDCGGERCSSVGIACGDGSRCWQNSDCATGAHCYISNVDIEEDDLATIVLSNSPAGLCFSCTNGVQDGDETAVDCGGQSCVRCADGSSCSSGTDCQSELCTAGLCASCF